MNILYFFLILFGVSATIIFVIAPLLEAVLVATSVTIQRKLNKTNSDFKTFIIYTPPVILISYLYILGNSTVLYFTIENFSALWIKGLLIIFSVGSFSRILEYKIRTQINSLKHNRYFEEFHDLYSYLRIGISGILVSTVLILIWPEGFGNIFKWPYVILCSYW